MIPTIRPNVCTRQQFKCTSASNCVFTCFRGDFFAGFAQIFDGLIVYSHAVLHGFQRTFVPRFFAVAQQLLRSELAHFRFGHVFRTHVPYNGAWTGETVVRVCINRCRTIVWHKKSLPIRSTLRIDSSNSSSSSIDITPATNQRKHTVYKTVMLLRRGTTTRRMFITSRHATCEKRSPSDCCHGKTIDNAPIGHRAADPHNRSVAT